MNQRLRQLMVQADYPAPEIALRAQRLAELIIQDCLDVVDGYTKARTFETHYDAQEQIRALFGDKE
jgi:hypothetical protein